MNIRWIVSFRSVDITFTSSFLLCVVVVAESKQGLPTDINDYISELSLTWPIF